MSIFEKYKNLEPNKCVAIIYFIWLLGVIGRVFILFLYAKPEGITVYEYYIMLITSESKAIFYYVLTAPFLYALAFWGLLKINVTGKYNKTLISYLWLITIPSLIHLKWLVIVPPLYATYVFYRSNYLGMKHC